MVIPVGTMASTVYPSSAIPVEFGDELLGSFTGYVAMGARTVASTFASEGPHGLDTNDLFIPGEMSDDGLKAIYLDSSYDVHLVSRVSIENSFGTSVTSSPTMNALATSISPDGNYAGVSGSSSGEELLVWDTSGSTLSSQQTLSSPRGGIKFNNASDAFACVSNSGGTTWTLEVRQASNISNILGSVNFTGTIPVSGPHAKLKWSPNDDYIVLHYWWSGGLKVFDVSDLGSITYYSTFGDSTDAVTFSNDSSTIAYMDEEEVIVLNLPGLTTAASPETLTPSENDFREAEAFFIPDDSLFVMISTQSATQTYMLGIWDTSDWSLQYSSTDTQYEPFLKALNGTARTESVRLIN